MSTTETRERAPDPGRAYADAAGRQYLRTTDGTWIRREAEWARMAEQQALTAGDDETCGCGDPDCIGCPF